MIIIFKRNVAILIFLIFILTSLTLSAEDKPQKVSYDAREKLVSIIRNKVESNLIQNYFEILSYSDDVDLKYADELKSYVRDQNLRSIIDELTKFVEVKRVKRDGRQLFTLLKKRILTVALTILRINRRIFLLKEEITKIENEKKITNQTTSIVINNIDEISQLDKIRASLLDQNPILKLDDFYYKAGLKGKDITRRVLKINKPVRNSSQIAIDPVEFYYLPNYAQANFSQEYFIVDPYLDTSLSDQEIDTIDFRAFIERKKENSSVGNSILSRLFNFNSTIEKYTKFNGQTFDSQISQRLLFILGNILNEIKHLSHATYGDILDLLKYSNVRSMVHEVIKGTNLEEIYNSEIEHLSSESNIYCYAMTGLAIVATLFSIVCTPLSPIALAFDLVIFNVSLFKTIKANENYYSAYFKQYTSVMDYSLALEIEVRQSYDQYVTSVVNLAICGAVAYSEALYILGRGIKITEELSKLSIMKGNLHNGAPRFAKNAVDFYMSTFKEKWKKIFAFRLLDIATDLIAISFSEYFIREGISDDKNKFIVRDEFGKLHLNKQSTINLTSTVVTGILLGPTFWLKGFWKRLAVAEVAVFSSSIISQALLNYSTYERTGPIEKNRVIIDTLYNPFGHLLYEGTRQLVLLTNENNIVYFITRIVRIAISTFIRTPILDHYVGYKNGNGNSIDLDSIYKDMNLENEIEKTIDNLESGESIDGKIKEELSKIEAMIGGE